MSVSDVDLLYLETAVELAANGLFSVTHNNPRVGCLLVKEGTVIGRGWHKQDGGPHAEVEALRDCKVPTEGATAYVSLEPCCWEGRTPACTAALIAAGVTRVVLAARDVHPRVAGGGVQALLAAGVVVDEADLAAARQLNVGHSSRLTIERPYVRLKVAVSLDGRSAMASGESQWITGPAARADVQYWRARSGAIVTGVGTVIADDPQLTVRDPRYDASTPTRVVADTHLRTPSSAALFRSPGRVCIATAQREATLPEAEIWCADEAVTPQFLLQKLMAEGCNEVLVEAGPTLIGSFVSAGLWDELIVYIAPKLMGSSARPLAGLDITRMRDSVAGRIASSDRIGDDLRVVLVPPSVGESGKASN